MVPFSILDLAFVTQGATPADALHHSLDLAQHAERWGYRRFWLAEHHNMVGIASAATSVVIGYIAGGTKTIRVGAGGIMLPNHSPIVIAEQFGTLESLYPGRIDLGLGRAPGTDQRTLRALRRSPASADNFPNDVRELQAFLGPLQPGQTVQAVPGTGLNVPIWILGSSLFGAQLAAGFGLPYAFASHFAPDALMLAFQVYRREFRPSAQLQKPYAMVGVNVIAADTDAEAQRLFTSAQQAFTNAVRGTRRQLAPPIDDIESYWSPAEKAHVSSMLACSFVGSPQTVRTGLERFIDQTGADELMVASAIYDHSARLRSYELLVRNRGEQPRSEDRNTNGYFARNYAIPVGSLIFPITGSPDHLIFQQPSACVLQPATHPGVDVLLQIQAQVPFDRPVTDRSMPFFSVFPGYNQAQFQLCFLIFTVGRQRVVGCCFNLANYPIWGISYFSFFKELFGH